MLTNDFILTEKRFCVSLSTVRTTLTANDLPQSLKDIRLAIEANIPHGRTDGGGPNDVGSWRSSPPKRVVDVWKNELLPGFKQILARSPDLARNDQVNHVNHLGTLGTGNHFLEINLDEEDRVWFMLHSGSRGVRSPSLILSFSHSLSCYRRFFF
jgi:tRNA-splicing ligase RtcB